MKKPEFLFFDLGNVLVHFDHEHCVKQLAELTKQPADRIRGVVFESTLQSNYEKGLIDTPAFCDLLREKTQSTATNEQLCFAASNIFWLNTSIIPLIASLRMAGIPIGILSNTCDAHWKFIIDKDYSLIRLFGETVLSFEVQSSKPESGIFKCAADRIGLPGDQLFFVDDLPANVQGANDAGWDAVVYESTDQLTRDLRNRGLRFNL